DLSLNAGSPPEGGVCPCPVARGFRLDGGPIHCCRVGGWGGRVHDPQTLLPHKNRPTFEASPCTWAVGPSPDTLDVYTAPSTRPYRARCPPYGRPGNDYRASPT